MPRRATPQNLTLSHVCTLAHELARTRAADARMRTRMCVIVRACRRRRGRGCGWARPNEEKTHKKNRKQKKERPRRTPRGTKPRGKNARGHARARPARACTCSLAPARGACLRAPAQMHRRELESARVRTWVSGRGKDGAPPLFGTSNLLAEFSLGVFLEKKVRQKSNLQNDSTDLFQ